MAKKGYIFKGWAESSTDTTAKWAENVSSTTAFDYASTTNSSATKTLYAVWELNQVELYLQGGGFSCLTVETYKPDGSSFHSYYEPSTSTKILCCAGSHISFRVFGPAYGETPVSVIPYNTTITVPDIPSSNTGYLSSKASYYVQPQGYTVPNGDGTYRWVHTVTYTYYNFSYDISSSPGWAKDITN